MPDNIDSVIRGIEDLADDITSNVEDAMAETVDDVVATAKRRVRNNDSVAKGVLVAGIQSVHGEKFFIAESTAPYSGYVEYGTGSKFGTSMWHGTEPTARPYDSPPLSGGLVNGIREWVREKNLQPHNSQYTQDDLAYFIARSIAETGNEPHPFMRPAWFGEERQLQQRLRSAVRRAI